MKTASPSLKIAPSILSADFRRLGEEVALAEKAGADMLHFDIMDGHFVPNITFGPMILKALRSETNLPFDVHLMVDNPESFIEPVVDAGGNSITVHVEVCRHLQRMVQLIRDRGLRVGVALNPATSLSSIEYVLDEVDVVLIMGVNPGFGGQTFIPKTLKKIREARAKLTDLDLWTDIAVDGGITAENVSSIIEAGANVIIAGTATFGQEDAEKAIKKLRKAAEKAYKNAAKNYEKRKQPKS